MNADGRWWGELFRGWFEGRMGTMRWMLKVLRRLGLALSAVLSVAAVAGWVFSVGQRDSWSVRSFEARPDWNAGAWAGRGVWHWRTVQLIDGRLWLRTEAWAPERPANWVARYWTGVVRANAEHGEFEAYFQSARRTGAGEIKQGWRLAGVGVGHERQATVPGTGCPGYERFDVAVPFWMLAIVFGVWPGMAAGRRVVRNWRRMRRAAAGLCVACGYDLRATPERCPECGMVVAAGQR